MLPFLNHLRQFPNPFVISAIIQSGSLDLLFIDNILIYSRMKGEHDEHLILFIWCLRENKLYEKLSKCYFYQSKIHYLGNTISGEGITVDPTKVEDIMECHTLKNV